MALAPTRKERAKEVKESFILLSSVCVIMRMKDSKKEASSLSSNNKVRGVTLLIGRGFCGVDQRSELAKWKGFSE
jgi:hypothetical protein